MASTEPLVRFYDLSGPKTWSPWCWCARYALNYKGIPYSTVKVSYPSIKLTCESLFPSTKELEATVPIIEILGPNYEVLNDSIPIAKLLNSRFTPEDGFKHLEGVEEASAYDEKLGAGRGVIRWIIYDIYENALDKEDGSREYFKNMREKTMKCDLKDVMEVVGGGESAVMERIRKGWECLRERMAGEDGSGEPTYLDFYDAATVKWIEAASPEKAEKLMGLWGDDTFTKLMKKVEKYSG